MKKLIIISLILALFTSGTALKAQENQDYLGLPGDNLNLYAVMKLFQESKTLEEFEMNLNDERTNINNLDLDNDNRVDYIKVIDNIDGDVHNIVLQVAVSPRENQDVAVFTVQRFNNGQVEIQLTGDEQLYGRNYIIEPITDDGTPNPGYTGQYVRTTTAEIAYWPVVRYIYLPSYSGWHSSWYWGYYPRYWHPWRPVSWHFYYGYHYNWYNVYYSHYRPWSYHRYSRWHDSYYVGHRSYSPEVYRRIETGTYKSTYSHPDQRRKGEAMFAKRHPDEYRSVSSRRSESSNTDRSNISNSRRPNSNSTSKPRTTITRPERNSERNIDNSGRSKTNNSVSNSSRGNNTGTIKSNESPRRSVNRSESAPVIRKTENGSSNSPVRDRSQSGSTVRQTDRKSTETNSPTVKSSERQTRKESKSATSTKKERTKSDTDNKERDRR